MRLPATLILLLAASASLGAMTGCGLNGLRAVSATDPNGTTSDAAIIDPTDGMLRWQTFPRKEDEAQFGPNMRKRITNVRYDLKIWPPTGFNRWSPAPTLVTGLTKPGYRPQGLTYGETYRWAARATFDLDGKRRVTQWTSGWSPPPVWDAPQDHPVLRVEKR